jgi:hypothetical protein
MNSLMIVLLPEPEGPAMRRDMLEVAGPCRDTDLSPVLSHRARALEGEARTKLYATGHVPLPAEVPVIEITY